MKVVVTITAYNEAKVIKSVLDDIPDSMDIIVVDDGSTDKTAEIAQKCGAKVVKHPFNLGQGAAVVTGFKAALQGDYDVIVEMDGDGQHDPHEIHKFLDKIVKGTSDFVVGSRYLGSTYKAPLYRRMGIPFFTYLVNMITDYNLTDSMCGFRVFTAEGLQKFCYGLNQSRQYMAPEIFIKASRCGLTVEEIPVHIVERPHGRSWKGMLKYGYGLIKTIVKTLHEG
ncbi:MAG: glycosyltransferase family 2 protein [Candidatus Methanofastidiosia archaeon]|jgi:glycosyltransferase involved in cell wall biosynthesis